MQHYRIYPVPPIMARTRTFWEMGSEKGLNCLLKVRSGYIKWWKPVFTVWSSMDSGRKRNYLTQFSLRTLFQSAQFDTAQHGQQFLCPCLVQFIAKNRPEFSLFWRNWVRFNNWGHWYLSVLSKFTVSVWLNNAFVQNFQNTRYKSLTLYNFR